MYDGTMLLNPLETARRLGITPGVLAKWRLSGRSPAYVKVGGRVRYRVADLEAWIAARVRLSTSEPERTTPPSGRAA